MRCGLAPMGEKKELLDHIRTQLDTIIDLLAQLARGSNADEDKS